jgi:hypothetical protein
LPLSFTPSSREEGEEKEERGERERERERGKTGERERERKKEEKREGGEGGREGESTPLCRREHSRFTLTPLTFTLRPWTLRP